MRLPPLALLIATLYAAAAEQPGWVDPSAKGSASTPQEAAEEAVPARPRGPGELILTIAVEGRPRIVSASSRVVHSGGPALGQAERAGRGA